MQEFRNVHRILDFAQHNDEKILLLWKMDELFLPLDSA